MGGKKASLKLKTYHQKLIIAIPRKATHCTFLPLLIPIDGMSSGLKPDNMTIRYFLWEI